MPRKTLPFRLYAQILIFSALVALGALILWPVQQSLYSGMSGIRDNMIRRLERQIGRKIRYSSISPSLLGSFDVRNISIMGHDDIPLLTMSRFRITYSLLDVLRGRTLAITSVQLDSPLLHYNTATDNDLLELFKTAGSGQESSFQDLSAVFPEKITMRIRNGKCLVLSGDNNFELDALNFNAGIFSKSVAIDGGWILNVVFSTLIGEPVTFQVGMTVSGLYKMDTEEGEALISISSITGDVSSEEQIEFDAVMGEGAVNIRKKGDSFPVDMSFEYGNGGKNLEGRLSFNRFRPARLISFSGGLESARPLLEAAVSGGASFKRGDDGYLGYSVNIVGSPHLNQPSQMRAPSGAASGAASYEINIAGNQDLAIIENFHFSMPRDSARNALFYGGAGFTGAVALNPFAPDGTLTLDGFSISGREGINADIEVTAASSRINLFCETLGIGAAGSGSASFSGSAVSIADFNVSLEPSGGKTLFSVSAEKAGGVKYFSVNGSAGAGAGNLDADILLDSFPVGDLAGLAAPFVKDPPWPDMLITLIGDTAISADLFLSLDAGEVSYNAPNFAFSGNSGGFSGLASIKGTGGSFELSNGQIRRGEDLLLLSAQADFAGGEGVGFSVNTLYHDLDYYIKGTVRDGKTVNIQGAYGLNVNITASGNNAYSGAINIEGFPVPFLGKPALLFLKADLRYDSPQAWSMECSRFELTDLISPSGPAQFSASGRADQKGVTFPNLYFKDIYGPLSGSVNLLWLDNRAGLDNRVGLDNRTEISGVIVLADNRENYRVEVSSQDHGLNLGLSGSSVRLGRFSGDVKNFLLDGEARLLLNSTGSLNADINISSLRGKVYDRELSVNAQAVMNDDELTVRRIAIDFEDIKGEIPQFVINNKTGTAGAGGDLKFLIDGKPAEGAVALNANFKPVDSWFEMGEALDYFDGRVRVEKFRYGSGAEPQTFDVEFTRGSGGAFTVSGGPRNMLRLRVDQDGNFYAGLSSPSPVRGTAIGNISDNTINASCNDLYIDIAGLFEILPKNNDIYLTGGYVNASLDIRGSLTDPEFFGQAKGNSLRFMVPSFIPVELRPIPFNIAIEGNEVRFGPVSASVGKGAGSVSGLFQIERWIPDIFSIDITVPRETPVPYSFEISGFTAGGDASGKLNLSRENSTLGVSGDLYVNNTTLGINSEDINKSQGQELFSDSSASVVNLTVSTGPVVEFIYPDSKWPILRANPDIGTKLYVKADTIKQQFSLASDIKIRGGEIFYFERSFYIRSGQLVFKENELRFAPRLTARAEVRDRNEDGPVTISMIVDNAPLMDFTARFESTPPLSQMEILALMGQSITGDMIDDSGAYQRAFFSSTVDLFAQFLLVRHAEKQLRELLRLDMFSFRTQLAQNFVLRMIPGLMPVDRISEVGNYFDNTTLFGGKYIGQDMFVQGMLSMRYDANKNTFGGMSFQPDFGLELQGAMARNYNFRIRWDFTPEHPENWYANDNSITLTVSKTF